MGLNHYLIYFDIAAIGTITAILTIFFIKKFFPSKANHAFLLMGITILVASVLDIVTCYTIEYSVDIPRFVNNTLLGTYYAVQFLCALFSLNYLVKTADEQEYKRIKIARVTSFAVGIVYFLIIAVSPWLHTIFYFDENFVFHRGDFYIVNHAMTTLVMVFAFGVSLSLLYKYTPIQRIIITLGMPLMIAGAVVQYFLSDMLVMNFIYAIWWFMLFETLQNPMEFVDQKLGIFNSKAFYSMLDAKMKKKKEITVLVFELEGLQFVDQIMGVENGDLLLKAVAQECAASRKDYLYHLDGTQFAYIFDKGSSDANQAIEWIKWRFLSVFRVNHVEVSLMARISAVNVPEVATTREEIMNSVGYSLQHAKKNNIFGVVWATRDGINIFKRQSMIGHILKRAIRNREFEVYYQPIYSTKSNEFYASEALVRLRDEELGFISPDEFVPIAEKNGLILEIGDIVFEKVCEFLASGEASIRGIRYIEVNLSVVQCMQEALHKHLTDVMDRYGIPYNMVDFEITETFDISDNAVLINNMNRLIELGCSFAMDDYGTGYSNANYLMDYPFKLIKLDKSFIWSAMDNEKAMRILTHTVAMIKSLDLYIVAEGVETEEQADILIELGCDYLQGYYFSPPVNQEKYLYFMDETSKKFLDHFSDWDERKTGKMRHIINLNEGKVARANMAAAKLSTEAK